MATAKLFQIWDRMFESLYNFSDDFMIKREEPIQEREDF